MSMSHSGARAKSSLWKNIKRDKYLLILLIPGIVFLLMFRYAPMGGLVIAFKDYRIFKGIWESSWVGFENFQRVFSSTDFWSVLRNTIVISFYKIIFGFPAPILLALLLNEIYNKRFKKIVQTIVYLPHFISWVVISGIMLSILSPTYGILGQFFTSLGMQPINLMSSSKHFRALLVISEIWREIGWGTIVYLATITTIDPTLYEAAMVDGANRMKQIFFITLPCMSGVIVLLLILRIGNLMNAGFEQILVMQNDLVRPISDILDTFVFRRGIEKMEYSYSTAVGLFNSVVALALVYTADRFAKFIGEEGLI